MLLHFAVWCADFHADATLQPQLVGELLARRLSYTQTGKRIPQIVQHMQKKKAKKRAGNKQKRDNPQPSIEEQLESRFPFLPDLDNLGIVDGTENIESSGNGGNETESCAEDPSAFQLLRRMLVLVFHFLPIILTALLAYLLPGFRQSTWYPWLATCCGRAGPTFIKWAQWSSIRTDLFPIALCTPLRRLHTGAPVTDSAAERVAEALGVNSIEHVFDQFDPIPVASGSIAQVHRATLTDGQPVAVKLRHPHTARLLQWDALILTILSRILPMRGFSETVQQFGATLAQQADLTTEAQNLEQLNANFRRWSHVQFPTPIFAVPSCIVETWEPGQIASDVIRESGEDGTVPLPLAQFLVTTGVGLYLKMLLVDNLMHSDLHPGNILVNLVQKGDRGVRHVISLVDAGMVARLSDYESDIFVGLLCSLGEGDGGTAADCVWQLSNNGADSETDPAFRAAMQQLFEERCHGYGTGVDVGFVLRGVLELLREHRVAVDANFATLVINVLCVDGLGQEACPSYNALDAAQPLLRGWRAAKKRNPHRNPRKLRLQLLYWKKQWLDFQFFQTKRRQQQLIDRFKEEHRRLN